MVTGSVSPELAALARVVAKDYVIEREIGRGGMGIVYLARDVKLDRPVAIKVLPLHLVGVATVRERFLREARTAARLSHPNIVPIHRADDVEGQVFFVMGYVDGVSLAERIRECGTLPPPEAVRHLVDVAHALAYAHAQGVVHRDIKPENILIERGSGRALVTDFGIARLAEASPLTATGQVLGTVHFMSPEQVSGDAVDGRSDLYSLGVVGYLALSGRLPFDGESASAVLVAHVTKPAPPLASVAPEVPPTLARVIDACLAKAPDARYRDGDELARALEAALGSDAAPVALPPVISERQAHALWARAAELQAEMTGHHTAAVPAPAARVDAGGDGIDAAGAPPTQGYRMDDVRAAAIEAGISERYVERAAAEMGLAPAGEHVPATLAVQNRSKRASIWAGAPVRIEFELVVDGEVPETEFDLLADTIRRELGEVGHVSILRRSLTWMMMSQNRRLSVSVAARNGHTTIRAEEHLSPLAGALFGGIVGGGGGGGVSGAVGAAMSLTHSGVVAGGAACAWIAASYVLARTLFMRKARRRERTLRQIVEELGAQVRQAVAALRLPAAPVPPAERLHR